MPDATPPFHPLPEKGYERIADEVRQDGYTITPADVAEIHRQVCLGKTMESILGRATEAALRKHLASGEDALE